MQQQQDLSGDFGLFLPYLTLTILTIVPAWFLFKRTGMSRTWVLFGLFPPIGTIIILFLAAFRKWPRYTEAS